MSVVPDQLKDNELAPEDMRAECTIHTGCWLYTYRKYTDFTLVSNDGTEFPVHRAILGPQSGYFEELFMSDQKEIQVDRKVQLDETADDVDMMVASLYKSTFQPLAGPNASRETQLRLLNENLSMLRIAKKYKIPGLKKRASGAALRMFPQLKELADQFHFMVKAMLPETGLEEGMLPWESLRESIEDFREEHDGEDIGTMITAISEVCRDADVAGGVGTYVLTKALLYPTEYE
ncbi:hypothetical protein BJ508DRAFT_365725 [Ascobolus immersus RN42]|uniref:BTB domain-containing protein n=1 Tax=Ascobolus immersus RN42 TaxID=1160509 RepID=A0A3N4HU92_ASCIM|nr:hypothetical protein BJ508DRAFT_365725 [Ascobolus immersus RN42]